MGWVGDYYVFSTFSFDFWVGWGLLLCFFYFLFRFLGGLGIIIVFFLLSLSIFGWVGDYYHVFSTFAFDLGMSWGLLLCFFYFLFRFLGGLGIIIVFFLLSLSI
ncbi:hypothetical protein, partial [Cytobacillus purgationiresistens]|uniref:hypothetical protein n=1 Tax=Cytobacillus purgationiresistens TaxID=863449 RepID=UPI0027D8C830